MLDQELLLLDLSSSDYGNVPYKFKIHPKFKRLIAERKNKLKLNNSVNYLLDIQFKFKKALNFTLKLSPKFRSTKLCSKLLTMQNKLGVLAAKLQPEPGKQLTEDDVARIEAMVTSLEQDLADTERELMEADSKQRLETNESIFEVKIEESTQEVEATLEPDTLTDLLKPSLEEELGPKPGQDEKPTQKLDAKENGSKLKPEKPKPLENENLGMKKKEYDSKGIDQSLTVEKVLTSKELESLEMTEGSHSIDQFLAFDRAGAKRTENSPSMVCLLQQNLRS